MHIKGKLGRWGLAVATLALVVGGLAVSTVPARAQLPPLNIPAGRFYGNTTLNGTGIPPTNLTLSASVGTITCGSTQANVGTGNASYDDQHYIMDIQSIPGCSTPGATVVFTASGGAAGSYRAKQTGTVPSMPGTPVHLDLDFQLPATPAATAPPPPPPPSATPASAPPPPTARPSTATPAPAAKPVVQQAPAAAYAPVAGARLPNTGTGGLLDQQTAETGWALLVIVLAALGVSATGLVAYRRQR